VALAISRTYSPEELLAEGWRVPFIISGIFGFIAFWVRQWLHETPVFREMQAKQELAREMPLKMVLREHVGSISLTMLMTWLLSAAIVVMILMTPPLFQKLYKVPADVTLMANSIAILTLSAGCIVFGMLADRFGPGRMLAAGSAVLGFSSLLLYQQVSVSIENINVLYAFCGFFVGVIGIVPSTAVMSFPAAVRFSGLSFGYNVAYAIFGGLTPVMVTTMLKTNPMAAPQYVAAMSVLGVLIGLYLWVGKGR
jgi:MFS family permease